ncbi:MAG: TetR/AcrR family transcriptional regulator [Mycobacteriales bacterium]
MTAVRRVGAEDSATRAALLDAVEQLMREHGYPGVTSRRVAEVAGVAPTLVHYYFRTMDDLLRATLRRSAETGLERWAAALASETPLASPYAIGTDADEERVLSEFAAMARHHPEVKADLLDYGRRFRALQVAALKQVLPDQVAGTHVPPEAVAVLLTWISRMMLTEQDLGLEDGHAEVRELVDRLITLLR